MAERAQTELTTKIPINLWIITQDWFFIRIRRKHFMPNGGNWSDKVQWLSDPVFRQFNLPCSLPLRMPWNEGIFFKFSGMNLLHVGRQRSMWLSVQVYNVLVNVLWQGRLKEISWSLAQMSTLTLRRTEILVLQGQKVEVIVNFSTLYVCPCACDIRGTALSKSPQVSTWTQVWNDYISEVKGQDHQLTSGLLFWTHNHRMLVTHGCCGAVSEFSQLKGTIS